MRSALSAAEAGAGFWGVGFWMKGMGPWQGFSRQGPYSRDCSEILLTETETNSNHRIHVLLVPSRLQSSSEGLLLFEGRCSNG